MVNKKSKKPLYIQICDSLREELKNRKSGEYFSDENELSARFKVNKLTLRKAIKILKGEGFIYSVKSKGIFMNGAQKGFNLQPGKSGGIIAFVADAGAISGKPHEMERIEILSSIFKQAGYELVLFSNKRVNAGNNPSYVSVFGDKNIAGAMIGNAGDNSCLIDFAESGMPAVELSYRKKMGRYFVMSDAFDQAFKGLSCLLSKGHRSIALFPGFEVEKSISCGYESTLLIPEHNYWSEMERGFREAFRKFNAKTPENWRQSYRSTDKMLELACSLAKRRNPPSAFLVMETPSTLSLLIWTLKRKGIDVPRDISIFGITNGIKDYGISCTVVDFEKNLRIAADLLLEVIGNPSKPPCEILIPVKMIPGETVRKVKVVS